MYRSDDMSLRGALGLAIQRQIVFASNESANGELLQGVLLTVVVSNSGVVAARRPARAVVAVDAAGASYFDF